MRGIKHGVALARNILDAGAQAYTCTPSATPNPRWICSTKYRVDLSGKHLSILDEQQSARRAFISSPVVHHHHFHAWRGVSRLCRTRSKANPAKEETWQSRLSPRPRFSATPELAVTAAQARPGGILGWPLIRGRTHRCLQPASSGQLRLSCRARPVR